MEDFTENHLGIDEAYQPLPPLYLAFTLIWLLSACSWTINTYNNRHFQTNKLQWALTSVPLIKVLQLTLSFLFWYSCFNLQICSLWMSFGVYVTGVLFQTSTFVSFLLVSHGYCITCERLSLRERRTTAVLGCVFYLTLVGYKASVPYFSVVLLINYLILFYIIFHHVSQNLVLLREQLSFIDDEDVHAMHDAVYTKYVMFKKFQGAVQILAVAELAVFINMDNSFDNYWLRLLLREWAQFAIFLYIGWTFRSQDLAPRFSIMPTLKYRKERRLPPIYSIVSPNEICGNGCCNFQRFQMSCMAYWGAYFTRRLLRGLSCSCNSTSDACKLTSSTSSAASSNSRPKSDSFSRQLQPQQV